MARVRPSAPHGLRPCPGRPHLTSLRTHAVPDAAVSTSHAVTVSCTREIGVTLAALLQARKPRQGGWGARPKSPGQDAVGGGFSRCPVPDRSRDGLRGVRDTVGPAALCGSHSAGGTWNSRAWEIRRFPPNYSFIRCCFKSACTRGVYLTL